MKDRCDLYSHAYTENERYECRNIISREGEQEKAFLENITNTKIFYEEPHSSLYDNAELIARKLSRKDTTQSDPLINRFTWRIAPGETCSRTYRSTGAMDC